MNGRAAAVILLAAALTGCSALPAPIRGPAVSSERLPCAPRRELVALFATRAQTPVAQGLATAGGLVARSSVIEVLATPDGLSWTAILTAPNGISCVLAGGEGWQQTSDPRVRFSP